LLRKFRPPKKTLLPYQLRMQLKQQLQWKLPRTRLLEQTQSNGNRRQSRRPTRPDELPQRLRDALPVRLRRNQLLNRNRRFSMMMRKPNRLVMRTTKPGNRPGRKKLTQRSQQIRTVAVTMVDLLMAVRPVVVRLTRNQNQRILKAGMTPKTRAVPPLGLAILQPELPQLRKQLEQPLVRMRQRMTMGEINPVVQSSGRKGLRHQLE
jgi:hypothetical protein